jgi:iron complex outermembrane receptor protein
MRTSALHIFALSSIAFTAPAFAQTTEPEPEGEIVVTAQKRESRLLDVSAPISVLDGQRLADRTVTNFEELAEQLPGVSITSDFGGASSKVISIRGVGGSDDYRPSGNPSVATHVDNIYQSSNAFLTMPFFDVQRVEVLKGPQGTLYGRNSTAGVINLITRSDTDRLNGYFTVQYESFNRVRAEGALSIPIAEGIGIRIAGAVDQGGGFQTGKGAGAFAGTTRLPGTPVINDPGTRKGWGDRDLVAGRATLNAEFSPDSKLVVKLFGSRDRGESQMPDSIGGVSSNGWVEPDNDPYTFYSDRYPERKMDVWGTSATFSQKLTDALDLDVVGGYQTGKRYVEGDGSASPARVFDYNFSDRVRQHSLEARLSNHDGNLIDWVAGGYYIKDKVDFRTDLIATDLYRSNLITDYHQTRESKAAFGQVDLNLTSKFILSGGIRYTADKARFVGSTIDADPLGLSTYTGADIYFDNDFDADNVSGRVTLSFRPTSSTNIWTSVGKGYKAGGFDGSSIFSEAEALPFKSEDLIAYEGGFKFAGRRGLFLSIEGFYYDFNNLQADTTSQIGGQSANVRTNVAKARSFGADIQAGATLVQSGPHKLAVDGGATLLRTKILEFNSTNPAIVAVNLGNDLPASPHFSGNAQISYTYTANSWSVKAAVDARHKSSEFKRLSNAVGTEVPGYTLLNGRLDLKLTDTGLGFFVYAHNLTDETYYIDRGTSLRLSGSPRVFGGGATLQF